MLSKFKKKISTEGRSYRWFHKEYLNGTCTYSYMIVQLNDPDTMRGYLTDAIKKFLKKS